MTKEETVGQRFSQLIQELGMSKNAFAISLEKTATVIQHLVEERNKPGYDLLCKVFDVYPNVSKDWLLQGSGPMFTGAVQENAKSLPADSAPESFSVAAAQAAPPVTHPESTNNPAPVTFDTVRSAEQPSVVPTAPIVGETVSGVNTPSAASAVPAAAPATPAADTSWQTALYTQQMAHQLAMAELRNQHLQEQQRLMQQMMDLMQRQLIK